jgi:hypothetical protein
MGKQDSKAAEAAVTSVEERPAPAAVAELPTVDAHFARVFPASPRGRPHADGWKHAAAAALHGWGAHQHHAGGPMRLSGTDYAAALDAACKAPLTPHQAALSEYSPRAPKRST